MQIFIKVAQIGGQFTINDAENYDFDDIKSIIREKFNIPEKFNIELKRTTHMKINDISEIDHGDTILAIISPKKKMTIFEEIFPNYKDNKMDDINTFINTNIYQPNDIIVLLWGNVIENTKKIREKIVTNEKYEYIHNLLSQQLPIPIIIKAIKQKTNTVNLYLIDPSFSLKYGRKIDDIRNIFDDIITESPTEATRLFLNGYEIYNIPALLILDYLGINIEHYGNLLSGGGNEKVSQWMKNIGLDSNKDFPEQSLEITNTLTMVKVYILPFTYGKCSTNPTNLLIGPTKCIEELKERLDMHRTVSEYYLYLSSCNICDSYPILHREENKYFVKKLTNWHNINEYDDNKDIRDIILKGGKKKIPKKYTNRLSKKDKLKQEKNIRRSIRQYKKGKYIDRPKLKSYRNKKSSWVVKFEKKYGKDVKSYKDISEVTGIPIQALDAVVKKGKGAYYSSGSRPNQTPESWGKARMYSYIMGGPTRKYDKEITDKFKVKLP